ncbi:MAG: beta-ketoacyl synthase N-terminal-like domain-containing protein [Alphaproteobacteria bacterium]|nr:beta-ketoacyl synthase N-terminal-like domain-containing protein [Alphaproteobacteria bacterium]
MAEAVGMAREEIDHEAPFEQYGLDSIIQVGLLRELEKVTGALSNTLLFEYSTVAELTAYLIENHADRLRAQFGPATAAPSPATTAPAPPPAEARPPSTPRQAATGAEGDEIAIIGLAGRYPEAPSLEAFWANLTAGRDCVTAAAPERWPELSDDQSPIYGGYLTGIDRFDHALFGLTADEAAALAPEIRLMLEIAWVTFEDAGYTRAALKDFQARASRGIGVFVGAMYNQHLLRMPDKERAALASNATDWHIVNRLSHAFDLTGPSIAVNTACSSSLTALHLACESLRQESCSMALAGGVNLTLDPSKYSFLDDVDFLGSGPKSAGFGIGDGMIPGEGAGAVLLKPLAQAERDGDRIDGVIRGSFVNHAGGRQMYGAPDPTRQSELVVRALESAGIEPETISYIEAAVNGSPLGDPIELVALRKAFARFTDRKGFCAIGSVKSNIGHLEAASGISQLAKVVLQLRHGMLAPSINATPRNPSIKLDGSAFQLQETLAPWMPPEGLPRRAMINSFGAGGSYATLIVEEYTPTAAAAHDTATGGGQQLFPLSARTLDSLFATAAKLSEHLAARPKIEPTAIRSTLLRREHGLPCRLAVLAGSTAELRDKLARVVETGAAAAGEGMFLSGAEPQAVAGELARQAQDWALGTAEAAGDAPALPPLPLPTYGFDHRAVFPDPLATAVRPAAEAETRRYRHDQPFLADHTVLDVPVLVGMTHASLALDAFYGRHPDATAASLHRLNFLQPVEVRPNRPVEVRVTLDGEELQSRYRAEGEDQWETAATGRITASQAPGPTQDVGRLRDGLEELAELGLPSDINPIVYVGPSFHTIGRLWHGHDRVVARIALGDAMARDDQLYGLHPLVLYSAFQAATWFTVGLADGAFLPFGIKQVVHRRGRSIEAGWVAASLRKASDEYVVFDATVLDDDGIPVLVCTGCTLRRVHQQRLVPAAERAEPATIAAAATLGSAVGDFVVAKVRAILDEPAATLSPTQSFLEMGLDSADILRLSTEIERTAGVELEPTTLFEYPNIAELTDFLADEFADELSGILQLEPREAAPKSSLPEVPPTASPRLASASGEAPRPEDIAVIGMSGLLADATDLDQFWANLRDGRTSFKEVPADHWDVAPWFDPDPGAGDHTYCKWGSFIEDVRSFDAGFFGIDGREADWMDPQTRLLLQSFYAAAEDAGVAARLRGSDTGVFAGICLSGYMEKIAEMNLPLDLHGGSGVTSMAAHQVSYRFDLNGPSVVVNTACSSSLVALHDAVRALRAGECGMAFVGGANLLLSSEHYRFYSQLKALSPSGVSRPFDEAADGFVPGEAVVSLLLKPLRRALEDGDPIHAVIKGSAALHGGRTPSFTAPGVAGEENVMLKAWADAGIDPATLSYIEAHGTATGLGDSIEVQSIKKALARFTEAKGSCTIGTAKANVGHTEATSGLVGLAKVILQMRHGLIPRLGTFENLSSFIHLDGSPLAINTELVPWQTDGGPRRAGVSAFGISGSYAHAVVEAFESHDDREATEALPVVVPLSARDDDRLRAVAANLLAAVEARPYLRLDDLAHSLQVGREDMASRVGFEAGSREALLDGLRRFVEAGTAPVVTDPLLAAWSGGETVDWSVLYRDRRGRRIAGLPTYPFAREPHWLPENTVPEAPSATPSVATVASSRAGPATPAVTQAEALLRELAAPILDLPPAEVPLSVEYLELGFTSRSLVGLVQAVESRLDIRLMPALLFDYRTISAFAAYLAETHPDRFAASSEPEPAPRSEPVLDETVEDWVARALESLIEGTVTTDEAERIIETGEMP